MVPIELKHIQKISQIRLNPDENIEHNASQIILVYKTINQILLEHPTGAPLDPVTHMGIQNEKFKSLCIVSHDYNYLYRYFFLFLKKYAHNSSIYIFFLHRK